MRKLRGTVKITALLTLILLQLHTNCMAQAINQISKSFAQYQQGVVQEKIFVHTDKSAYLPGEILWFKIYDVDASHHKPLDLSKVVYVDVLDNNNNAVLQAKIAMKNGIGSGSLYIPVSLSNGNYKFRAYTNWMKNFSPDYYFEKNILIVNPLKSPDAPLKETVVSYDVQFFPEGGNLVAGIMSKVAFKVTASDGKGLSVYTGAVIDQHNDTVAHFRPLKFGMGNFIFTPVANNTYKAIIKTGFSNPVTKDLPIVNSSGYVMQLKDNGMQLQILVSTTGIAEGEVYLFAHTRQVIKVAESTNLNSGTASFVIDKTKLGDGISQITIFNSAKKPVCERLYFKRPKQQLVIGAVADQSQYAPRKKVSLNISAQNISGNSSPVNLSLSVYRIDSLQHPDADNITNYLWLRSDLRGNIESPDYYFKNINPETEEAIDNLMLSQGWRRFQWNNVLNNTAPVFNFLPEYNDHLISARIVNTATGAPARDIVAYLSVPGKRVQLYASKSDSLGRLIFNTKQLFGPGEIIAQTNSERDTAFRIDVLSPFSEQYTKSPVTKFNLTPGTQKAIEEHSIAMQAQNVYTGNQLKQFYDPGVDSSGFYGKPYKTYLLDNYTRFTTMEEVLREYIREVNVVRSQKRYHIKILNDNGFLDGDPLVMLDDVPVFNIDKVIAIDPLKVRKLEVMRERYFYGPSVHEGILSYTTYKGDLGGVEVDPHAVVLDYEGLQLQREFYSPVYDTDLASKSRLPDFRNLLYWQPNISISPNGKTQVSFYTSDQTGEYIGLVQGITTNGEAGSQYFNLSVK
ncbi:hypothetical protein SNE25_03925 [Mucilaginibacter sabulilitoris]|uniref:Macroglobulin domain-containing protein n=1 Tax=Mucilaginibacter sabulilitoris TaxID=1173583 RepID=A0ABZ0TRF1_9SPHI|nr:hypothetical protein [Mucilaginibacter sabulilitoris]WPU94668.1 hypothetical protein SNE25_03925 [Mucilaginibacter sabulilitoris]